MPLSPPAMLLLLFQLAHAISPGRRPHKRDPTPSETALTQQAHRLLNEQHLARTAKKADKEPDLTDSFYPKSLAGEAAARREDVSAEIRRISRTKLSFGKAPSVDELCAFGRALPRQLVTISITGQQRIERVRNHFKRMCLPNTIILDGVVFSNVSETSPVDRDMLGRDNLNSRSLGELAIMVAHRRALERCLAEQRDEKLGCLIMEDDFTLTGPRLAERWNSSFAVLQQMPDWHLLFLGRCMDTSCGQLRVSQDADLYRSPRRNISFGEDKWQTSTPMCLHSYMVTPEGARRLLKALWSSEWNGPTDWAPAAIAADSNIFTISPALMTQVSQHCTLH